MNRILILLLSMLSLASCKTTPSKDYILLTGTISNTTSEKFRLSGQGLRMPIALAEDGSFTCDTMFSGTGRYTFTDGRNTAYLYLKTGGTYNLTATINKFKTTAKITGTNPDASNYLLTEYEHNNNLRGVYAEYNSLNETDFSDKQQTIFEANTKYLESFKGLPKEFEEVERKELYYTHYLALIKYESLHRRYTNQPDFKVSDNFMKQFESVDFLDEQAFKRRGSYDDLVKEYFVRKANEFAEHEGIDKYLAKLKVFGEIPNDYIKNNLLNSAAKYDIAYTDNIDTYYNTFIAASTSEANNKSFTEKYTALKKLSKGEPSPVFTDYVNNAGGTNSLNDFKGKYVYMDVWATWCGPCIAEVPALKKIEKQYHNKNIEFISISIDTQDKREAWSKMIADKALGGVQLLADKDWSTDFIVAYKINSIPRFILIDPNGNIVSWNAPRPSNDELITLFNELGI
ncbi:TlpA family protein disulfide reductase [Formosa sp. 3Alg 14/1]|uniref:TlpA family protein disulfide reductase n=1 Tax=Formosa sp. 3Alg 14/1 TaxID=3382190 RepID=UPI0039BDFA99